MESSSRRLGLLFGTLLIFHCEEIIEPYSWNLPATARKGQHRMDSSVDAKSAADAIGRVTTDSVAGLDNIPAYVIKSTGWEYIASLFDSIISGKVLIPIDWRKRRVTLTPKSNSGERML